MTPFHWCLLAGFVAVGLYRYVLSPGWNIPKFLATELRPFLQAMLITAASGYFAYDIAAFVSQEALDAMLKAPKFAGFAIGALGAGTDVLSLLKNLLSELPFIGKLFGPKA